MNALPSGSYFSCKVLCGVMNLRAYQLHKIPARRGLVKALCRLAEE